MHTPSKAPLATPWVLACAASLSALAALPPLAHAQGISAQRAPIHDSTGVTAITGIPRRDQDPGKTDPTTGANSTTIYQGGAEPWTRAFANKTFLVEGWMRNDDPIPDFSAATGQPLMRLIAGTPLVQPFPPNATGCNGQFTHATDVRMRQAATVLHINQYGAVSAFKVNRLQTHRGGPFVITSASVLSVSHIPYAMNPVGVGQPYYPPDSTQLAYPLTLKPAEMADHIGRPLGFYCSYPPGCGNGCDGEGDGGSGVGGGDGSGSGG